MAVEKTGEDQLKAVWFAAGTAAFMACIERAVVVSLFAHWRVWAFLALNLLLLAILFTSKSQTPSNETEQNEIPDSNSNRKKKVHESMKKKVLDQECKPLISSKGVNERLKVVERVDRAEIERKRAEDDDGKQETEDQLSQEELNKRVEAFIAMFRQHLVSDAKSNNRYRSQRSFKSGFVTPEQRNSPSRVSFSSDKYIST